VGGSTRNEPHRAVDQIAHISVQSRIPNGFLYVGMNSVIQWRIGLSVRKFCPLRHRTL